MPIRDTYAPRFASRAAAITGMLVVILLVQSILILNPARHLSAASENHLDQLMTMGSEPEQTNNCNVSSYQVQPGDTINDVAGRAGTTSQRVVDCNSLSSGVVYAGQVLSLPGEVNTNRGTTPQARYTRAYRPTPPAANGYQRPNNGSPYSNQQGPRQQRRR